ncbi:hypothetical protein M3Y95_00075800 [Aphelenchoides besseyi]|nr:hypothetical protein M3Y95_00075800 [Aphelenchoides besseyi]
MPGQRILPNVPVKISTHEYFRQNPSLPMENNGLLKIESLITFPYNRKAPQRSLTVDHSTTQDYVTNDSVKRPERKLSNRELPKEPTITSVSSNRQSPQFLAASTRRSNFQQRCLHETNAMGNDTSRLALHSNNTRTIFSGSFDSSVKKRVLPNRTDSTTSDDGALDMKGLSDSLSLTASAGSIPANSNPKRLLSEKKTSEKNTSGRNSRKSQQIGISNSAQTIINFCIENAKGDIVGRVVNRASKRDNFAHFISNLSAEQYSEFVNSLRSYFMLVLQSLQSLERIKEISIQYGIQQVSLRGSGFKADYFAVLASSLTHECVLLDAASHSPSETIEAWSQLIEPMFTNIRDGYYQRIRYLRKSSHCFNSMFSQSSDMSNEEAQAHR